MRIAALTLAVCLALGGLPSQGEELTLATATRPEPNRADEPLAAEFSFEKAVQFLDQSSLEWTSSRKCFTCHTNYVYLMARPTVSADATAHREIRAELEKLVTERWPDQGPRWDAEVIMAASVLAINDAATTDELHPTTRTALDRIWTVQREDGGFTWLKCKWPPMESDDHFGAIMAAIAVGSAPAGYATTPAAREGLRKLQTYFDANPPPSLHHRAMLVWASAKLPYVFSQAEKEATLQELRALQKADGGWALPTLMEWERGDGKQQDTETSDGYATGLAIYVLRKAGTPANDPAIQRGIDWLKTHQRESGRWYTRSLFKDNHHFISHAGTAFAVLALTSCDAVER